METNERLSNNENIKWFEKNNYCINKKGTRIVFAMLNNKEAFNPESIKKVMLCVKYESEALTV